MIFLVVVFCLYIFELFECEIVCVCFCGDEDGKVE